MVAPKLGQHCVLANGFYTLGQGWKIDPFRHRENGRQHVLLTAIDIAARDVGSVDFDPFHGKASNVCNGRVPLPKSSRSISQPS